MVEYWIDDEKGVELLCGLVGKKVVDIDVESYSYGKVITIKFENGMKL